MRAYTLHAIYVVGIRSESCINKIRKNYENLLNISVYPLLTPRPPAGLPAGRWAKGEKTRGGGHPGPGHCTTKSVRTQALAASTLLKKSRLSSSSLPFFSSSLSLFLSLLRHPACPASEWCACSASANRCRRPCRATGPWLAGGTAARSRGH